MKKHRELQLGEPFNDKIDVKLRYIYITRNVIFLWVLTTAILMKVFKKQLKY